MEKLQYRILNSMDNICGLEIFKPEKDKHVVVITELPNGTGVSVTNSIEYLMTLIYERYLNTVHLGNIVWIELTHKRSGGADKPAESYSVVTADVNPEVFDISAMTSIDKQTFFDTSNTPGIQKTWIVKGSIFKNPTWRHLEKQEVEKLLVNRIHPRK